LAATKIRRRACATNLTKNCHDEPTVTRENLFVSFVPCIKNFHFEKLSELTYVVNARDIQFENRWSGLTESYKELLNPWKTSTVSTARIAYKVTITCFLTTDCDFRYICSSRDSISWHTCTSCNGNVKSIHGRASSVCENTFRSPCESPYAV